MPYIVRNLPALTAATTGANAVTNAVGGLDDAFSVTIYLVSTAAAASTGAGLGLAVSQFDPSIADLVGVTQSTGFNMLSSTIFSTAAGLITSSGMAFRLDTISFRGLRITGLTSATAGEKIAFISKQIEV